MPRTGAKTKNKAWGVSIPMPAPGDLQIVQDFLNTWDVEGRAETFASPAELADWLKGRGLLPPRATLSEADRKRVLEFRDGLRALVPAGGGVPANKKALGRVRRAAKGARLEVRFEPDGTPRLDAVSQKVDYALGRLLAIIVRAHVEGRWPRLKLCANAGCRKAFYDDAKRPLRKWCTRRCGDAVRSRAYRRTERYKGLNRR